MRHSRVRMRGLVTGAAAALALTFVLAAGAATYSNSTPLPVPDATGTFNNVTPGQITSNITIPATDTSTVSSVSVTLLDVTSQVPDDLDIVLVSPNGTRVILMSDAGGGEAAAQGATVRPHKPSDSIVAPTDITFSDGGTTLPDESLIGTGPYAPANYGPTNDFFCTNETDPAPPFTTTLSSFNTQPASGTWMLVVQDDCIGKTSSIGKGWCLIINTSSGPCESPTAVTLSRFTAQRTVKGVRLAWRTASERDVLGYNLYRAKGGKLVKVNRALVRAMSAGAVSGATYTLLDRSACPGAATTYRLQVVSAGGSRSWVGSAKI